MAARVGIERRNAHQPMHAGLGLEPAIGVLALDQDGRRFDAGLFAFALLEQLPLVAVRLGPARVHAQQHRGPILAFGAARAGMDFEIGVVARPPRPTASIRASCPRRAREAPTAKLSASATMRLVVFGLGQLDQAGGVVEFGFERRDRSESDLSSRLRSRISVCARCGSFQKSGASALAFSSSRRRTALSQSKMPPQQGERLLDLVDGSFGFCAHLSRSTPIAR